MQKIYKFDNLIPKMKQIFLFVLLITALIVYVYYKVTNIKEVLYIIPISIIMVLFYNFQFQFGTVINYKSIIVDNINNQLKIISKNDEEIFLYKDIQGITFIKEPQIFRRRSLIHLTILLKTGYSKTITFSNFEFDLDFLKKLPPYVCVDM